ncbi:MAG: ABC transporter ATP-binding protein [Gammaproteobacteria bacterium]|nr:ABC transporter ATP-binding protein [Gammaproteobacteria bacterium]
MNHAKTVIEISNVSKRFGSVVAVDDNSLTIQEGEFFALLGPSGCGKTTLLRMLAGLEVPTEGKILIDGEDMHGVPPNHRPINMVFQSYAVFPHMTVFENVGYGLKVTGVPEPTLREGVMAALDQVQLGDYQDRMPDQLSGGQKQRVALARALVKKPKVLLLDEPLSALDAKLREAMQLELVKLQNTVGITFVIVTHDQDEALSMADRIAVINEGKIEQIAEPRTIYEFPANRFVADFIGKMNVFDARVKENGDSITIEAPDVGSFSVSHPEDIEPDRINAVAIRPEKTRLTAKRPDDSLFSTEAQIVNIAYHGKETAIFVEIGQGTELSCTVPNTSRSQHLPKTGDTCWVSWQVDDMLLLE